MTNQTSTRGDGPEQPRTRISDLQIAAVRAASPIDAIAREHGVELEADPEHGGLRGRCLFHMESKPSLHMSPIRGYWHCFGCAEGGDVITFVRKARGISFSAAVEYLAQRASIDFRPEPSPGPAGRLLTFEAYEATAHRVDGRLVLTFQCGQDDTVTIGLPPAVARLFVPALTGPSGGGQRPTEAAS